jgi:hypothetical protein
MQNDRSRKETHTEDAINHATLVSNNPWLKGGKGNVCVNGEKIVTWLEVALH